MTADDTTGHLYTAWHPLFVWLIQQVLAAEWWDVLPEAQLTLEPQRADAIVIRRRDVADVFQVIAYTAQWMNLRGLTEPGDVSIRVVASSISPRFLRQVKAMGGAVEATGMRGVLEGHLGVFPLRVVDAVAAYPSAHEHLLYGVSADVLRDPSRLPPLDARETRLYHLLAQGVRQDRRDPTKKRRVMKDRELVDMTMDQVRRMIVESLTPEERVAGLTSEERLRGIPPEERLRDVSPEHAILALSDTMLAQLPETFLAGLPEDVQAKVRARLGR